MQDPIGRYRVRPIPLSEHSSPDQVVGPRFFCRDDAESYADALVRAGRHPLILEKLARAGCWLPLATLG